MRVRSWYVKGTLYESAEAPNTDADTEFVDLGTPSGATHTTTLLFQVRMVHVRMLLVLESRLY